MSGDFSTDKIRAEREENSLRAVLGRIEWLPIRKDAGEIRRRLTGGLSEEAVRVRVQQYAARWLLWAERQMKAALP